MEVTVTHWIRRLRDSTFQFPINWYRRRFPQSWGIGRAEVHASLAVTLSFVCLSLFALSFVPAFREFRVVAFSLPAIWCLSLLVRIVVQQLALGAYACETYTVVCPTGNIQADYEYLPTRPMLAFGTSGQLASVGMMALGLVINAALAPEPGQPVTTAQLLDFHGGVSWLAFSSQLFWINAFLFCIHLLPTVPFDMRVICFAFFSWRNRAVEESQTFRDMASLNSHLSAVLVGVSIACFSLGAFLGQEIWFWSVALLASLYLFIASQWEVSRGEELEEQFRSATRPQRIKAVSGSQSLGGPHLDFADTEEILDDDFEPFNFDPEEMGIEDESDDFLRSDTDSGVDIDDILRKVHKVGFGSLDDHERNALISASRQFKEKRGTNS